MNECTTSVTSMQIAGPYSIGSGHWPGISKLIEECGEVMQVAGKLMGSNDVAEHWDGTNLRNRLVEELGDLEAAIIFTIDACGLDSAAISERRIAKYQLFQKWHGEQG